MSRSRFTRIARVAFYINGTTLERRTGTPGAGGRTLYSRGAVGRPDMAGDLDADRVVVRDPAEAGGPRSRSDGTGGPSPCGSCSAVGARPRPRSRSGTSCTATCGAAGTSSRSEAAPRLSQVARRGAAPGRPPSRYWVAALSERASFDLDGILARAREAAGVRKSLLLALVDEESDVTYYAVRESEPRGHLAPASVGRRAVVHLLGDPGRVGEGGG